MNFDLTFVCTRGCKVFQYTVIFSTAMSVVFTVSNLILGKSQVASVTFTALHHATLYHTVLNCTALHCIALPCFELHFSSLYCTELYCAFITVHCNVKEKPALLFCKTLHYITLHENLLFLDKIINR